MQQTLPAASVKVFAKLKPEKRPLVAPAGPKFVCFQNQIAIVLPEPHPGLHAHNKGHWTGKRKLVIALRWHAKQIASEAMDEFIVRPRWKYARIHYLFLFRDRLQRDSVNAMQSLKPAIDGIVDSGLIPDDNCKVLQLGHVACGVDTDNPRAILLLERLTQPPDDARTFRELGFPLPDEKVSQPRKRIPGKV